MPEFSKRFAKFVINCFHHYFFNVKGRDCRRAFTELLPTNNLYNSKIITYMKKWLFIADKKEASF